LYVSVFEGNEAECAFDQEAFDIWKQFLKIALSLETKDNFWKWETKDLADLVLKFISICDEERAAVSGRSLVNADHPQVVEIWNNVFMEFNRKADGSLENYQHST
jgi:alanyl-tRNA synthetase